MWLKVHLTRRAQAAFKRLPSNVWCSYSDSPLQSGLSKHELYTAKFQTWKREKAEGWANFAQDLRVLADKAFPDLQEEARDRLSLNHYMDQIANPQINFAVKRRRPNTLLEEAVAMTLEPESYCMPTTAKVSREQSYRCSQREKYVSK